LEQKTETNVDDLFRLLDCIEKHGVRVWLHGGWAMDALTGRTRPHADVDLLAHANDRERIARAMAPYVIKKYSYKLKLNFEGTKVDFSFFTRLWNGMPVMRLPHYTVTLPAGSLDGYEGTINGRKVNVISPLGYYCEIGEEYMKSPEKLEKNRLDRELYGDRISDEDKETARRYFRENQTWFSRLLFLSGLRKSF
jgi:lincosamide nucleotidyltransferase A/C/D/E